MIAARKIQTIHDFLALANPEFAELIDGQIVYKSMLGGEHASMSASVLRSLLGRFFKPKRSDGSGGWWIQPEVSLFYPKLERILQADIAGWKRELHPSKPLGYPVKIVPNWVCEICHTTQKKDTTTVPETLAAHGVSHYWLIYVETENLQIFALKDSHYSLIGSYFKDDGKKRLPPFESLELDVAELLGNDPLED